VHISLVVAVVVLGVFTLVAAAGLAAGLAVLFVVGYLLGALAVGWGLLGETGLLRHILHM
jgi:hypothetical protein